MEHWLGISWKDDFALSMPAGVIIIRGTIVFLALFTLFRVVLKREAGSLGLPDLLVVVLLGDASQNAMSGPSKTVGDGLLLVLTIILWAYTIDWLGYRFPWFERLVEPAPLTLVKDGKLQRRNMRKEFITEDELMGQLRLQGITDIADVKIACMESGGEISVVQRDEEQHKKEQKQTS